MAAQMTLDEFLYALAEKILLRRDQISSRETWQRFEAQCRRIEEIGLEAYRAELQATADPRGVKGMFGQPGPMGPPGKEAVERTAWMLRQFYDVLAYDDRGDHSPIWQDGTPYEMLMRYSEGILAKADA